MDQWDKAGEITLGAPYFFLPVFQSDRVDFVRLMLDAKESNRDVDLTMTADDIEEAEDEQEHKAREDAGKEGGRSTRVMTMEVSIVTIGTL